MVAHRRSEPSSQVEERHGIDLEIPVQHLGIDLQEPVRLLNLSFRRP